MKTFLDVLWNWPLTSTLAAYAVSFITVMALLRLGWRPRAPNAQAEFIALALMVALLPWMGFKMFVYERFAGQALAIAERMPHGHPQLTEFSRLRAVHDVAGLNQWTNFNRDPVDAGVLTKTQLALAALPPSIFKSQAQAEVATGYVSRLRFEAIALSIISISTAPTEGTSPM